MCLHFRFPAPVTATPPTGTGALLAHSSLSVSPAAFSKALETNPPNPRFVSVVLTSAFAYIDSIIDEVHYTIRIC